MQHKIEILTFKYGEMLVTAVGEVTQEDKDTLFVAYKFVAVGGGKVAPVGEWFRRETLVERKLLKDMPALVREVLAQLDKLTADETHELYKMYVEQRRAFIDSKRSLMTYEKIKELSQVALLDILGHFIADAVCDKRGKEKANEQKSQES